MEFGFNLAEPLIGPTVPTVAKVDILCAEVYQNSRQDNH